MGDKHGRFVHGHKPIAHRDPATGRFVAVFKEVDKKEGTVGTPKGTVEEKVDKLLKEKGMVD